MSLDSLVAFTAAGISLIVSPGPATLSMAAVGSKYGFRTGLPYLFGCAAGLMLVMLMVVLGLTRLLQSFAWVGYIAAALGIGYILFLAWKIWNSAPVGQSNQSFNPPGFFGGVFVSLANPKAYAVMGALFASMAVVTEAEVSALAAQMSILATITVIGNLGWTFMGDRISRLMQDSKRSRWLNRCFAILLLTSVLAALLL